MVTQLTFLDCTIVPLDSQVIASINAHYGEPVIRARFAEYVSRFVRMTGRYEEEFYGQTSIGYPSQSYRDLQLGSGFMFPDEQTKVKEWAINSSRIEGWRRTRSYRYWREVGGGFAVRQAAIRSSFADPASSCSGL